MYSTAHFKEHKQVFFKSSPVYVVAKQGCNAHVGKAVSLQPGLQLLLGDIQRDERVGAIGEISRGVHVGVEHPRWLEGGDHNAQSSWQGVHLEGVSTASSIYM